VEQDGHSEELAMATELAALLIWDKLMGANLFVSAIAMALGSFAAVAPNRAAKIWGSGDPLAFFIFCIFLFEASRDGLHSS